MATPTQSRLRYRLATKDDVASITAIANWYAQHTVINFSVKPEPLEQWMKMWEDEHERLPWYVVGRPDDVHTQAVADTADVAGFAKASPFRARCAYQWTVEVSVYLDPSMKGHGAGMALYDLVLRDVQALGYHMAVAGITLPNAASVRLHESFGFVPCGVMKRIGWKFGAWHDVGFWQKSLNAGPSDGSAPPPVRRMADLKRCPD